MENIKSTGIGSLKISEDVISSIVRLVTTDVEGVGEIVKSNKNMYEFIFKPKQKFIDLKTLGDAIEISICVTIKYGYKVQTVAEKIQQTIKANIQSMTGITVSRVNVDIADMVVEKSNK